MLLVLHVVGFLLLGKLAIVPFARDLSDEWLNLARLGVDFIDQFDCDRGDFGARV